LRVICYDVKIYFFQKENHAYIIESKPDLEKNLIQLSLFLYTLQLWLIITRMIPRLPDVLFAFQEFGYILESHGMEYVGIVYCQLVYFTITIRIKLQRRRL
jgi:hypothetical protein